MDGQARGRQSEGRVGWVVAVGVAVGMVACGGATQTPGAPAANPRSGVAPASNSAQPAAGGTGAEALVDAHGNRLTSAGSEPRRRLRAELAGPGERLHVESRWVIRGTVPNRDVEVTGTVDLDLQSTVLAQGQDGTTLLVTVSAAKGAMQVGGQPAKDDPMEPVVTTLAGKRLLVELADDHALKGLRYVGGGPDAALPYVAVALRTLRFAVPAAPVGVGAAWSRDLPATGADDAATLAGRVEALGEDATLSGKFRFDTGEGQPFELLSSTKEVRLHVIDGHITGVDEKGTILLPMPGSSGLTRGTSVSELRLEKSPPAPAEVPEPTRPMLLTSELTWKQGESQRVVMQGVAFVVKAGGGRLAAVTTSHHFTFKDRALARLRFKPAEEPQGKAVTIGLSALGSPRKPTADELKAGDLRADLVLFSVKHPPPSFAIQKLDDRALPDLGERVWFPNRDLPGAGGYTSVPGTVREAVAGHVMVVLDRPVKLRSLGGTPVISQKTGAVIGTLSRGRDDGRILLVPAAAIRSVLRRGGATPVPALSF